MTAFPTQEAPPAIGDRPGNRPDVVLLATLIALAAIGLLMIFSATRVQNVAENLPASFSMERQLIFVAAGLIAYLVASLIDYREYRHFAPHIYLGLLALLGLVFMFAPINGARRWIDLGFFALQPSEFAKLAVVLAIAVVLAPARTEGLGWGRLGRTLAIVGLPASVVFLQPDLGTTLVFAFVALVMLFAAGASVRQTLFLIGGAAGAVYLVMKLGLLSDFQMNRLRVLLDPRNVDPTGIGFQLSQSKLAIGAGQLFGKGLFQGTQTNFSWVPEQDTDFIFTAVAEQLGFVGGILVIAAFLVVVWRLLVIARSARDRYGALVAVGVAAIVVFHVFVNVGMTMGIMPVTGVPLPFISSGGSSFIAFAFALGVANSVWLRRSPVPGETYIL